MKVDHDGRGVSTVAVPATSLVVLLIAIALIYPLHGVADDSLSAASEKQTLPPLKSSKGVYYPDTAKRVGLEGKVLVAFDIVSKGRVGNLSIIFSDDSAFENTAKEYTSGLRFDVPSNWANSESRYERYHIGFVFCIPPSSLVGIFGVAASPVTISTNRIPGSPIRNPPAAGSNRAVRDKFSTCNTLMSVKRTELWAPSSLLRLPIADVRRGLQRDRDDATMAGSTVREGLGPAISGPPTARTRDPEAAVHL